MEKNYKTKQITFFLYYFDNKWTYAFCQHLLLRRSRHIKECILGANHEQRAATISF